MIRSGVIILAHGSRGELGAQAVTDALADIVGGLKAFLSPDVEVVGGAMQFNHPDIEEAATSLIAQGVRKVVIAPYFLFPGRHITEDLPEKIEELKATYPEVEFVVADGLGRDDYFTGVMARRIMRVCPDLGRGSSPRVAPEEIEPLSMNIIEGMLPPLPALSADERVVVKRIVHASGDIEVAPLVRFSSSAIESGVKALRDGSPVFTDVRMVASGITRGFPEAWGGLVTCALDAATTKARLMVTRTAQAIYDLGHGLDHAVVAIGNAPTALFALLDMVDHEGVLPALVVGMPVGFVRAAESKAELMLHDVPCITIEGTRGGSALAAAAVNALIRIARDRRAAERAQ